MQQIVLLLAAMLLLAGALVTPGRARDTTPTPAAPPPFTLRITDETARGDPLAGVTVVFSVTTRSGAVTRIARQTDAHGEIVLPDAQPPEVVVFRAFDDTQRDYYLPANRLETMALHLPVRGPVVPLVRVDPRRLTFDYRLMPEPVESAPGLVVTATPVPMPLAVRVAGRSPEQDDSSGSNPLPLIVLGVLAVGIAAVPVGVWLWRMLRSGNTTNQEGKGKER